MVHELSSVDISHLVKELKLSLEQAKVDRIYHPQKEEVLIQFHIPGKGRRILRILLPIVMYLTDFKGNMPDKPSGFCMYLRKHLESCRLQSLRQVGFERIVEFVLEKRDAVYKVYVEFIPPGNVIICKDDKIVSPLYLKIWKDRSIRPGVKYEWPSREHNAFDAAPVTIRGLLGEKELVKVLAIDLGMGGRYAEEVCTRAGIDKKSTDLSNEEIDRIIIAIKAVFDAKQPSVIYKDGKPDDVVPFKLAINDGLESKEFGSFNEALDSVFTDKEISSAEDEHVSASRTKIGKTELILKEQEKRLHELEESVETNRRAGELIFENYLLVQEILEQITKARKEIGWKEIKKKLKGHALIKQVNEKESKITIVLGD
ncbi:hypothetical protein COV93_07005 [Candidatus Woesearchaeota archaeon CG11_big_fil_rev_8_21_14_0_20_43_8]|nr:MAG: hypothetical protein COV93_07005 [Candidatus Woesearchaeota archaeon CG11_big_fil_rev_8_21_14_0_20_43_8]PIO04939.1 MAG: hypothetical protein COT47_06840 [Candidatus Woesearchaeota archaeon CG08_land_8_20_14_0_20_43_7]